MSVSLEQFVERLEESGLLSAETLKEFLPPLSEPKDAEELARELVRRGKLTRFQAQQIWQGKSLVLGNYVLLEKIGAGGMGQVFKAEHRKIHRIAAIKILPLSLMKDARIVARFQREVQAAARLSHPNIVRAFDAGQEGNVHFLVMEYVAGSDLASTVRKNGRLPVEKVVNYILQAARGLEAAHAEGMVHRDIKPGNLLLSDEETVKILDMGLARLNANGDTGVEAELTQTGTIMGTVDYMAPEQALSTKSADARADIYSLGCTLYFLLTGKAVYGGDTLMKKLLAHRDQRIPAIRALRPAVPKQLEAVFSKMVAKRIADRYQTMAEVIDDLARVSYGEEPLAAAQEPPAPSSDEGLTDFFEDFSIAAAPSIQPRKSAQAKSAQAKSAQDRTRNLLLIGGGVLGVLALLATLFLNRQRPASDLLPVVTTDDPDPEAQVTKPAKPQPAPLSGDTLPGNALPANEEEAVRLADRLFPSIDSLTLVTVPTSEAEAVEWRFSTTRPRDDWTKPGFDDSAWTTGRGVFGDGGTPGSLQRTAWTTSDIWLRRTFEWNVDPAVKTLLLKALHDDGLEVFINGQSVLRREDFTPGYVSYPLEAEAVGALRTGTNTLAVHGRQTAGPQYVDVGLFGLSADPEAVRKHLRATKVSAPWEKLAIAYHSAGDQPRLDKLLKRHPAAASGIGDLFAYDEDWDRAVAEYGKAITPETKDADLFAKRAEAYEKLQKWEEAIDDWEREYQSFVADKTRYPGRRYGLFRRAKLYERLRQFDKARDDYDRMLKEEPGLDPLVWRSGLWAQRGMWKEAARDYQEVWDKREPGWYPEWYHSRDRALLKLMAGDTDGYQLAIVELLARTKGFVDPDSSTWLVHTLLAVPGTNTAENWERLSAAADRIDPNWNHRLKGWLLSRRGEFQQAADLLERSGGDPVFEFLAAMAHSRLGHAERARQLSELANAWIRQQRDNDPGCGRGVPQNVPWQNWSVCLQLQRETTRMLAGRELSDLDSRLKDARLKGPQASAPLLLERARLLATFGVDDEALDDLDEIKDKIKPPPATPEFLGLRGRLLANLHCDDEALADLNRAVVRTTDARDYAVRGRILRDRGDIEGARKDLEKSLDLEPTDETALLLADILLADTKGWTVLTPGEMKSAGGATLKRQPDGSILAGGKTPERDVYTIATTPGLGRIRAIRLEALPDRSLPAGGPGRHSNGNFQLNEFQVISGAVPARLAEPFATFHAADQGLKHIVDGTIDEEHWTAYGQTGRRQAAYFGADFTHAAGDPLRFAMDFTKGAYVTVSLGRFRLSVSDDQKILDRERQRVAAMKLADPRLRLEAAYAVSGGHAEAVRRISSVLAQAESEEARKPILQFASLFDDVFSELILRQPEDPQLQLALARRLAERGRQRLTGGEPAAAEADLEAARAIFDRLRASDGSSPWTVLTPAEVKSEYGSRLEVQTDGSVFVPLQQPVTNDTYTVVATPDMKGIVGLRLEALADARLPSGGPGLAPGGNFVLSELTLHVAPSAQPAAERAIRLRNAIADFSQVASGGFDVRGVVDGNRDTAWAIHPQVDKDHTAVFELVEPLGDGQPLRLTFRLSHQSLYQDHNLGRFRLSLTSDPATLQAAGVRLDLNDSEVADLHLALAKAHVAQGNTQAAIDSFAQAIPLAADHAGKRRIIEASAPLKGTLEQLAEQATPDGLFQAELSRYFGQQDEVASAETARAKARDVFERQRTADPDAAAPAIELANLLLDPLDSRTTRIVPTAEKKTAAKEGVAWRFSTKQPSAGWPGEGFDDSKWTAGSAGFGANGSAPGLVLRTAWTTPDIWLRYKFEWKPDPAVQSLLLRMIHDDGFELFLNGRQVLSRPEYSPVYVFYPLDAEALALLKPGTNTLAVHCRSTVGPQFIDVGLLGLPSDPRALQQRFAAMKLTDPWARLAAAWHLAGDQPTFERLVTQHPSAAAGIGDLYAADRDWNAAIAEYDKALATRELDEVLAKRAAAYEATGRWDLAVADWLRVGRQKPDLAQAAYDRFLRAARWSEATQLGLLLIEQNPADATFWMRYAPVVVLAGDDAEYRAYCRRMAKQFAESQLPDEQDKLVKACLLRAGSLELAKPAGSRLSRYLDGGAASGWFAPYAWAGRALLAYRNGDNSSAIAYARKSRDLGCVDEIQALNLAIVAMAHHQLRRPDEARRAFDEAGPLMTRLEADPVYSVNADVLIAGILLREAEALLNAKSPQSSPGAKSPPSGAGREKNAKAKGDGKK